MRTDVLRASRFRGLTAWLRARARLLLIGRGDNCCDPETNRPLVFAKTANSQDQFAKRAFGDKSVRSYYSRRCRNHGFIMDGEEHDLYVLEELPDFIRRLNACEVWKRIIEHNNIGS